jgi:peptide/nickel transport system substrate-binding protein
VGRGVEIITDSLTAGLARAGEREVLFPLLGETVPATENGLWKVFPDGRMETTWTLKPNAFWHDGTPVTSNDLLFTIALHRDREMSDFYTVAWDSVENATAPDSRTLVVTWKRPYIEADALVGARLLTPAHILQKPYTEDKASLMQHPYWSTVEFVGAGPYKLREWERASHFLLDAFDLYVLGRAKIDIIEIRIAGDPNVVTANILAGTADASVGKSLSFEQARELQKLWKDGRIDVAPAAPIMVHPQHMTPNPAVIGNVQFRKALLHGVDRQQLVDEFLGGSTPVHHSLVPPINPFYPSVESRITRYDYDPRKAVQLIEGLGYVRGPDGIFRDGSGQRLEVELRMPQVDINIKSGLAIQDYWTKIGVSTDAFVIPNQRAGDLEYRWTFPGFELVRTGGDIANLASLHSSQVPAPANNFRGANRARYRNPELDELVDRYFVTIPPADRVAVLMDIVGLMTTQAVHLGLFYDVNPTAISNRLVNASAVVNQDVSWNIHEWDFK